MPPIPVAPADLRRSCPKPPVAVGDDAMVVNRRYEVALQDCDRRRARAVAWSDRTARDYGPQPNDQGADGE
ncbi:hypothetical protein [Microbaculum marinisediminis]|uniref:Uncharacterized protein n=1 Tax=Microbaculum marinisediminis TaxID=2931392 RepID=A0AAW5QR53_9HYPH|nr:hypothetical protein [Microbaculum sp. A6E488]MCT8970566.1 hypothetical protein [Microbaculum sp. A6E488]